jgi:peptidoglycan/xylan/chitin deacetylase (PgdA/CDA1 family)
MRSRTGVCWLLAVSVIVLPTAVMHGQQVALTVDDLPVHGPLPPGMSRADVATKILDTFKEWKAPEVYGFVNARPLEKDPDALRALTLWTDAGYPLASHSFSHMDLHTNTAEAFQADIAANEPLLGKLMPAGNWRWFRYPFLREGDTPEKKHAVTAYLGKQGYTVAQVTLDFGDYAWNGPYVRCLAKDDTAAIDELKTLYVQAAAESLRIGREKSQLVFGRDIKHVMLLHIGAFETVMLPRLMELLTKEGFTVIPLADAQSDPAYQTEVAPLTTWNGTFLDQLIRAKGLKAPARAESPFPKLDSLCR